MLSEDTELLFNSGQTLTLSANTMLIINDYSQIEFNGVCKITVKNDCEIQYSEKIYKLFKNESLIINALESTQEIIFTDITQISIEFIDNESSYLQLYVFNDVVKYQSQLYIASLINDKKSITINGEIYYIYDDKIQMSGATYYKKCIFSYTRFFNIRFCY